MKLLRLIAVLMFVSIIALAPSCKSGENPVGGGLGESSVAGASGDNAPVSESVGGSVDEPAGGYVYSTPFVAEPVTVNWATFENADPAHPYSENLICFQELEKVTGVHITIEAAATADYNSTMRTRLAAGIGLPEVMAIPGGAADQTKYVNAGLFLDLTELIGKYAPHLTAWYGSRPDLRGYLTAPDGKIYSIATSVEARSTLNYTCPGIRYDWIEKLGRDVPKSIPELYDLLLAFKNGDPNGNGEADEIPVIGKYDATCYSMGWSYGLHLSQSQGWYYDAGGKVIYEWITGAACEWVSEMAKWYAAGLFDPDFTAPQQDKSNSQAMGNIAGMAQSMSMMYPQWNERMKADFPQAKWKALMPVSAEGHSKPNIEREFPYSTYFALTKDCKDPALNIKLIDWMMASPEGSTLFNFGREGLEFDYADGEPILSKENVHEYERGSGLALQMLGATSNTPLILSRKSVEQRFLVFPEECEMSALSETYKIPMFPKIIATDKEADEFTHIMADIDTYREESIVKFIMGATPLSEWDAYAAAVRNMNIDGAVAIRQAQLDRYNASLKQ